MPDLVQVDPVALLPTQAGCAVFLGNGEKSIVFYIEPAIGASINDALSDRQPPRPLTHDLSDHRWRTAPPDFVPKCPNCGATTTGGTGHGSYATYTYAAHTPKVARKRYTCEACGTAVHCINPQLLRRTNRDDPGVTQDPDVKIVAIKPPCWRDPPCAPAPATVRLNCWPERRRPRT